MLLFLALQKLHIFVIAGVGRWNCNFSIILLQQ